MKSIYKSDEGARQVRERYVAFLNRWPVAREEFRLATSQGETFVVACGAKDAPPLVLLHGGAANSAMWMGDIAAFAAAFRVYCVDLIGEPGLSAPSRPRLASDAYARWLDEVFDGLSIVRVSIVGVSLGGWLALDYSTRRSERVERLAVLCPGGVGRQKVGIVFATLALRMCGSWGKGKLLERILGRAPADAGPAVKAFGDFVALIHRHFRPRMVKLPVFSDDALRRLDMPVLAIAGGRDVMLDSASTKARLERCAPKAEVVYLPEAGHFIPGQTGRVVGFLRQGTGGKHE
ncbi:MAG TPA: alpha/beta hydrolase [Bryobacteraceae bacterium]|nr:alpha/beta hydrolase [Bryobacteraceae bacterium]